MDGIIAYAISRKYVDDSLDGVGALRGKNCTIDSITNITDSEGNVIGHRVTFKWTSDSGVVSTSVMDVMNGEDAQQIQQSSLPVASASEVGNVYQYVGATTATLHTGYFYQCIEDATVTPHTYSWQNIPVQDDTGDEIQVETLPTAEASIAGKILQYVGATTAEYTNGFFYQCVQSGGVYVWIEKNVQTGGGGGEDIAVNALPDAAAEYIGKTYILKGSQIGYQTGGIYKCVEDSGTYSWELINDPASELTTEQKNALIALL